jgi:D-glycero-alpha-D-manno-heptose 1-phosphate guanylyltransferase
MAQKLGMNENRSKIKDAIILAGGLGTRIRDLYPDIPKCMIPVAGKPFLDYLFLKLQSQGIEKVILSVGYKKQLIKKYYGKLFNNLSIVYSDESEPLGTGGAMKKALEYSNQECCLVLNGDSYIDFNISNFFSNINFTKLNILTVMVNERSRYGALSINEDNNEIRFNKGISGQGFINAGVYILNHELLNNIHKSKFSFEEEILRDGISTSICNLIYSTSNFIDIGIPEDALQASDFFQDIFYKNE